MRVAIGAYSLSFNKFAVLEDSTAGGRGREVCTKRIRMRIYIRSELRY